MLGQRRRQCSRIMPTLAQHLLSVCSSAWAVPSRHTMLGQCRAIVYDAGPTLNQHRANHRHINTIFIYLWGQRIVPAGIGQFSLNWPLFWPQSHDCSLVWLALHTSDNHWVSRAPLFTGDFELTSFSTNNMTVLLCGQPWTRQTTTGSVGRRYLRVIAAISDVYWPCTPNISHRWQPDIHDILYHIADEPASI